MFRTDKRQIKIYTHMLRVDVVDHVVWAVQGVTQGVLVGSFMQTFNHT